MKKQLLSLFVSTLLLTGCGDKTDISNQTKPITETTPTTTQQAPEKEKTQAKGNEHTGESLVKIHCTRCHYSEVYTRADRKITSLDGLTKQVRMCETQLNTQLFPEDEAKIVKYLNETYYKF